MNIDQQKRANVQVVLGWVRGATNGWLTLVGDADNLSLRRADGKPIETVLGYEVIGHNLNLLIPGATKLDGRSKVAARMVLDDIRRTIVAASAPDEVFHALRMFEIRMRL